MPRVGVHFTPVKRDHIIGRQFRRTVVNHLVNHSQKTGSIPTNNDGNRVTCVCNRDRAQADLGVGSIHRDPPDFELVPIGRIDSAANRGLDHFIPSL